MAARLADERMVEARASGDRVTRMQSVVVLVAALVERATAFGELLDNALNAPDHFQSLRTEVRFLQARGQENAQTLLDALVRERVLKRHQEMAQRHDEAAQDQRRPPAQPAIRDDAGVNPRVPCVQKSGAKLHLEVAASAQSGEAAGQLMERLNTVAPEPVTLSGYALAQRTAVRDESGFQTLKAMAG